MNNDLISREALKKAIEQGEGFSWDSHGKDDLCVRKKYIDNAPTVEPTFGVFKEMLCAECGKRPQVKVLIDGEQIYPLIEKGRDKNETN